MCILGGGSDVLKRLSKLKTQATEEVVLIDPSEKMLWRDAELDKEIGSNDL